MVFLKVFVVSLNEDKISRINGIKIVDLIKLFFKEFVNHFYFFGSVL